MTYATGQTILASHYMGFRGSTDPNVAYSSDVDATNKLAALVGVGYGTRGYGQISASLPAVIAGSSITAAGWNDMFSVMSDINTHTGSSAAIPSNVLTGDTIHAYDGTGGRLDLAALISTLDTNRHLYNIGQMSLSSKLSSTRTTSWSSSVTHEFTVAFTGEDSARYFFNSGGQIYLSANRSGGTTNHLNDSMTQLLSDMGTIKIGASATTYTGSGGTAYSIGYYGLTNNPSGFSTLFVHAGSAYGYTTISYSVRARVESYTGSNGGNGSLLRIQTVFASGIAYYVLDGTLVSNISQLSSAGVLTIASPTYTTTSAL